MKKQFLNLFCILALGLCCRTGALAAEGNTLAKLDEALKAADGFQYGQDAAPLKLVESIVTETAQDSSQCRLVEKRLLESLRTSPSRDTREFICRQLFTIGSVESIPQLEKLLTDPALGHMARFALARNQVPEASAALARALEQTSGPLQAGIINSLGQRRYAKALPAITQLLSSTDPLTASVAAAALGDIGGTEAVKVLESARAKATSELKINIDAALLACADRFVAADNKDAARRIYEEFSAPGQPENLRSAGLRGLVQTDPEKALPLLITAIKGSDAALSEVAIGLARSVSGTEATTELARLLPSLPPQTQELLLSCLGSRGDGAAGRAVVAALDSQNEGVRVAACAALGSLGDQSAVNPLIFVAAHATGPFQQAARASLAQLSHGDVNGALVQRLGIGETKIRVEVVKALAARRATSAGNDLLKIASDPDPAIRREVIRDLGAVVDDQTLPRLVALAAELKTAEDLAALEESVAAAFQRIPSREKQADPLLATFAVAPANAKPVLLHLLGLTATARALEVTRTAVKDENVPVREAAIRSLAEWPDAAPADDLLQLVRTADRPSYKVIALRGYVRMAGLGKNSGAMYARALEVAERPEDKKLVLSSLGSADGAQAVDLVEPYLKSEQLRVEAAQALVQIVDRLRQTDATRSRAALKSILAAPVDSRIHQQAQET
ncbi:MAG: HEAT repeat domain-containing protein, partial [Verrucomicrobia bacterium]|nr:HEAT repeat domain-containing protein [Verrucomicrobiota bacterium]